MQEKCISLLDKGTNIKRQDHIEILQVQLYEFGYNLHAGRSDNGICIRSFPEEMHGRPGKSKIFGKNLSANPDSVKSLCNSVKMAPGSPVVTYAAYKIDDNGNISMMSGSTNDSDGKIARENAERRAERKEQMDK